MEKNYHSFSFSEYPPVEILGTDMYLNSIKRLSFQYRRKEDDKLIAYIALSKECIPVNVSNIDNHMVGCRILDIYVIPEIINGYEVDNVNLRMALLEETECYINAWVDLRKDKNFEFDYFWFYHEDIKKKEIIDEISYMTTIDNISFKIMERYSI